MSNRIPSGTLVPLGEPDRKQGTQPKINSMAVIAAVSTALGFVTAVGFFAGAIFGHIALFQIKRSAGRESGRQLALVAVIVSWIPIALVAVVFGLMLLFGLITVSQGG